MLKRYFVPPGPLLVPLESLIESFLKKDDINAVWKLETRFRFKMLAPTEQEYMTKLISDLKEKWNTGKANYEEQILLGMVYEFGFGVEINRNEAKKYYQAGVDSNYAPALYRRAQVVNATNYGSEEAKGFLNRAVKSNYAPALTVSYEVAYFNTPWSRFGYGKDCKTEDIQLLDRACELNYVPALALSCKHNNNVENGIRASEQGSSEELAYYYKRIRNLAEAKKYFEIAIEEGSEKSSFIYQDLADMYMSNEEFQDFAEAARIYRKIILMGDYNLRWLVEHHPEDPVIVYHAGMAGIATTEFNDLAKNKMDTFVALSMDDKWEDICKILAPALQKDVFAKREQLKAEVQGTLEDLSIPGGVARMVGSFWSSVADKEKIETKTEEKVPKTKSKTKGKDFP
ncbi:MAG: SEL1-like repeat protein [Gammaproteobacteria bacterium]